QRRTDGHAIAAVADAVPAAGLVRDQRADRCLGNAVAAELGGGRSRKLDGVTTRTARLVQPVGVLPQHHPVSIHAGNRMHAAAALERHGGEDLASPAQPGDAAGLPVDYRNRVAGYVQSGRPQELARSFALPADASDEITGW